jgi:hypothetical protein
VMTFPRQRKRFTLLYNFTQQSSRIHDFNDAMMMMIIIIIRRTRRDASQNVVVEIKDNHNKKLSTGCQELYSKTITLTIECVAPPKRRRVIARREGSIDRSV